MLTQNKRLLTIFVSVAFLLLIPFVAMQISDEVNWSAFDFLVMGVLLFSTGLIIDQVLKRVKKMEYRIGLVLAVLIIFFLIWAELAVGIFGTPFAGS